MTNLRKLFSTRREAIAAVNDAFPRRLNRPIEDAKRFLREYLSRSRLTKHVYEHADELDISRSTINRAAHSLKVKRKHTGYGKQKRTWWSL